MIGTTSKRIFLCTILIALVLAGCEGAQPPAPAEETPAAPSSPASAVTQEPTELLLAPITTVNAEQLVELARYGKGKIRDVDWSPDGDLLAVASTIGIWLYDAETLEDIRYIETDSGVTSVAFAPDGQTLASGSHDGTVRLWGVPPVR